MMRIKLTKTFSRGRQPFQLAVDIALNSGITVFFGASGSGKTLTMQCVAGLSRPDSGLITLGEKVFYDSQKSINLAPQKRRVGYMPQDYALFPHLSLMQNVAYARSGFLGRHVNQKETARALEILERFGLAGLERHLPSELSGGQKQRAALARAINSAPQLLLLDEPFSALDPLLRQQSRQELAGFIRNLDAPAIIISHDPEDVDAFAGMLAIYRDGRAKMVEDYADIRPRFANAAECLRWLEGNFQ